MLSKILPNASEVSAAHLHTERRRYVRRSPAPAANDRSVAEPDMPSMEGRSRALMERFASECRRLQVGSVENQVWFADFDEIGDLDDLARAQLLGLLEGCSSLYLQGFLAGTCIWQIESGRLAGRSVGVEAGRTEVLEHQERVLLPLLASQWSGDAVDGWRARFDDTDLMLADLDEIYQLAEQAPSDFAAGFVYSVVRRRREVERLISLVQS